VERLIAIVAVVLSFSCTGCKGDSPVATESQESQAAASQAAANWTPEQVRVFENENKKAKAGLDK
jgi:hypothetical protein